MNFFEHQDRARQNTQYLVGLFLLSVLCIVVMVYLTALITLGGASGRVSRVPKYSDLSETPTQVQPQCTQNAEGKTVCRFIEPPVRVQQKRSFSLWNPGLFVMVAVPTVALIGLGSLYKIQRLKAGGAVIAAEMGGRYLDIDTANEAERQLLNIVEEMAIASGISVPAVYILDQEQGINAFAAGFTPNDAVIGITRGCLDLLNRDELQGVIGHEFSHILNGDMRLNLRLIGVLNGILVLYILGRLVMDFTYPRDREGKSNGLFFFGIGLVVIGSVGAFFGRLIKAAVSRQREFLADASSVQFTRNPQGIASALRKISQHHYQALIVSPRAEENSHLFFGSALQFNFLGEMFATHPPLDYRIKRIEGNANKLLAALPKTKLSQAGLNSGDSLVSGLATGASTVTPGKPSANGSTPQLRVSPDQVIAQVGTVAPEHYAYARALVAQLPESLQAGIREQPMAIAIVYALFLDYQNPDIRTKQLEWLHQVQPVDVIDRVKHVSPDVDALDPGSRLPLLDLTIPALRQSSGSQCQEIFKVIQGLVQADGRWALNEFTLQVVLWHRLRSCFNKPADTSIKFTTLEQIWNDCLLLLSVLAQVGQDQPDEIAYAFRSGVFRLPGASQMSMPEKPIACNVVALKKSLDCLRAASPKLKQGVVDACAHTVLLDNVVTVQESELLRAIAITLDCPLPPFLTVGKIRPQKAFKKPSI